MSERQPNILLFTTDQHRGDHLSIAGHPVVETPHTDALLNRGAYFPHAYTEIPSTTGARRILHSGKRNYDCGLIGYSGAEWHEPNTLAGVLADNDYHCFSVGFRNMHPQRKLYGFHTAVPHDLRDGVDDYADWLRERVGPNAAEFGHGVDPNTWVARPWHLDEQYHSTRWTTDTLLDLIAKRDPTKPFFAWCSHLRPHSPYDPPQAFWDMYIDRHLPPIPVGDWARAYETPNPGLDILAWRGRLTDAQNQRMRAGYMGSITHLDYELGRLMRVMHEKDSEAMDNTLVIFTSDHGDMMSDHNLHRKCYAYEGSARVPFMVRYPKALDLPTGTFENVVGLQDVMPTILDAAGIECPDGTTGASVLSAARGDEWREYIHGEHSPCYCTEEAMHYLTDAEEKYVWFPCRGEELFFDLVADPHELNDLASDPSQAIRVSRWRETLARLLSERGDGFTEGGQLAQRDEWYGPVVGE